MLILRPIVHETIWGGTRLQKFAEQEYGKIGHLYSVYARDKISNLILNGLHKGKTLNDVFPAMRRLWGMERYSAFPLTIALVDAAENLSVQVHPDDKMAYRFEGERRGKRESWYFLEAPQIKEVYNGCRCENVEVLKKVLNGHENVLEAVDTLPVEAGDYVYVEPGTLHALTRGSLVYEIEEGSDLTYRLYDYDRMDSDGRRRPLQVDKSLESVNVNLKSKTKRYGVGTGISERTYETLKLSRTDSYQNVSNRAECLTILEGNCECEGIICHGGMTLILTPGDWIEHAKLDSIMIARMKEE